MDSVHTGRSVSVFEACQHGEARVDIDRYVSIPACGVYTDSHGSTLSSGAMLLIDCKEAAFMCGCETHAAKSLFLFLLACNMVKKTRRDMPETDRLWKLPEGHLPTHN